MDIVAGRFKARYLELEGKPHEALALYRSIIAETANDEPTDDLLPVFVQASALTIKLGDTEGGIGLLVRAAEHFADHGVLRPVIELCKRLPKLDPALAGQHVRFARRMLERGHVAAARLLLTDLATRRRKTKLRQTLEKMASWPDDVVRTQLTDFLQRVDGRHESAEMESPVRVAAEPERAPEPPRPRVSVEGTRTRQAVRPPGPVSASTAEPAAKPASLSAPPVPAMAAALAPPARVPPAPPPAPAPPAVAPAAEAPRTTGPRERGMAPEPVPWPSKDVEWVTPPTRDSKRTRARTSGPSSEPVMVVPPLPRKPRSRGLMILGLASGAVALVVGGVVLGERLSRPAAPVVPVTTPRREAATLPVDTTPKRASPVDSAIQPPPAAVVATRPAAPADSAPPRLTAAAAPPPARRAPTRDTTRATVPTVAAALRADTTPKAAPPPAHPGLSVDYPVVIVDGLLVTQVTRQGEGVGGRILVAQALPSGDTLELGVTNLGPTASNVGGSRVLVRPNPSGGSIGTARVGAFLITARAPIPSEALEPLLKRLIEVRPD